ncbi:hypothetical protein PHMEG_0003004 [Phytophthora megakarya]|uniref:Uncharacterized protein n=1 Tax=Phytophthora megakarya TaxID=4795 RepID=A0A225WXT5_9STRA|nr:hypothetical protein PHMEG_0003004 [Phytophthora megakarya]
MQENSSISAQNTTVATTTDSTSPVRTTANEAIKKSSSDKLLASLTRDREGLIKQLARNEKAMDEFHRGIERSPLMDRNELIRELLLMEYRIGNLEIDKMHLQTLHDLQRDAGHSSNSKLENQYENNDEPELQLTSCSEAEQDLNFHLPTPVASERSQPHISHHTSDRVHLPEIKQNKPRGGFLEELREHLYSKSRSHRERTVIASPVSYHKHWGLHLNNASLPYIRLKKKNPVPLYVEPTTPGSLAAVIALGKTPSTTSLAEPYLKSLKNRQKSSRTKKGKLRKNVLSLQ